MNTDTILRQYAEKYGELPRIPMMQCSGVRDPKYVKMLFSALAKGKKVTEEDYNKYFPMEEDAVY
jgi:hypothetical protein